MTKKLFVFVILLLSSIPAFAQVDTAWVRFYNGPGYSPLNSDWGSALALDASRNVYVTGTSVDNESYCDYVTIKYDSSGNQLWVQRYNGPGDSADEATDIAVDIWGNVYVTGRSMDSTGWYDCGTIKYYPDGNMAWVRRFRRLTPYSGLLEPSLAVDGSCNVYVATFRLSGGAWYDYSYVTVKYDSNGNELWVRDYDGPGNDQDYAQAIAVDASGNVYVTGASYGSGTREDYATIKYYPNGDTAWVRRYNGPGNHYDFAYDLAVDTHGNVLVTGASVGSSGWTSYTTIKYDSNGNELWVSRYDGVNTGANATAMTLDPYGNVYITGSVLIDSSGSLSLDFGTVKYDSSGNELWAQTYSGPGDNMAFGLALAVDGSGNVYVTGMSYGGQWSTGAVTIKYNRNGNEVWVKPFNFGSYGNTAKDIVVDDSKNLYVAGSSTDLAGGEIDWYCTTVKYVQPPYLSGDANGDGVINVSDVVYLINYLFISGPAPAPIQAGDVNCDGVVNVTDVVYLINYLFIGGPPPCI